MGSTKFDKAELEAFCMCQMIIDEVAIYNRALSFPEIQAIYNAGSAGVCEITPPSIVEVNPTNGITDVAVDIVMTTGFSEDMDASTITDSTFTVSGGTTGTVTYDAGSRTAPFTPSSDLAYDTTHTVTITSGVKDLAGNSLPSDHAWIFTTRNLQRYDLSITKSGAGSGTVSSISSGLDCGADCVETYDAGMAVTLTASADTGSIFYGWSGGECKWKGVLYRYPGCRPYGNGQIRSGAFG